MMKLPFLQLFTGDWLKDPCVSMLSPAARGIWFDFICVMAESDRSGTITGTRQALARLTRCAPDELSSALNELALCRTAEVKQDDNGLVTVTNRRMAREAKEREMAAKRQQIHREKDIAPPPVTPSVTPPSRPILQRSEVQRSEKKEDSDKVSKPCTEGGGGGKPLRGRETDIARLCEIVLNKQWVNDAGKWVERIRANPEKVWRVMSDVKNAAAEGRIKTTPGQMAEYNYTKVFK